MKKLMKLTAAATVLCAFAAAPAHAQLVATGLSCNAGNVMQTGFDPDALACSGAWEGNDAQLSATVEAQAALDFASIVGPNAEFTFVGKSDDANNGPFTLNPDNSTSGTLTFDAAQTGFFAVSLKAGNAFSVYLFNGGAAGLESITFSTLGVSVNDNGQARDLSHASLFAVGPVAAPIPEPQTYALMLAGLGVVAFLGRRRKHQAK